MLTPDQLERQLLDFVRHRLADADVAESIDVDTKLFEDRVIDSLKVLELIAFVQSALGKSIPDAQIVLANFRSIRTIARVFTGDAPTAIRRTPRRRSVPASSGVGVGVRELMKRGEIVLTEEGALVLRGPVALLIDYFDGIVRDWALELGAREHQFPELISLGALDRAGFLSAFPDKLVRSNGAACPPAVCYHHYPSLANNTVVDGGSIVTAVGRCYRNEFDARSVQPVERLRSFTMREIITVGDPALVERLRNQLMERVRQWCRELGLVGGIEIANDPFFTDASRGRLLMQQILPLKYELRLNVADGLRTVAAASFNNHQQHFGKAFSIRLANGECATSGCSAFGWERWIIAFVDQHGPNERDWPLQARSLDVVAS